MIAIFVVGQCCGIAVMAFAPGIYWFIAGSTVLGFFTIAPYLLPAYVSKRVDPRQLGHVTATLTTGVLMGILLARAGAGVIGEYLGWRTVYYIAALLMSSMVFILPMIMVEEETSGTEVARLRYLELLASIGPIVRNNPEILLSGTIQGLNFGLFLSIWLGLGLHLTSPAMGYGVDVVGYLALLAIVNLFVTPRMGRFADKTGPRRARLAFAVVQAMAIWLLYPFGSNIGLLIIPLLIMNIVGPPLDVSGRMLFLSKAPQIRTRLTAVYIIIMFLGGGVASWLGAAAYELGGWAAISTLAIAITTGTVLLSLTAVKRYDPEPLFRRR